MLTREYPELGDTLNYGIPSLNLLEIEMQFGSALPTVVRKSYLCVDGQEAESAATNKVTQTRDFAQEEWVKFNSPSLLQFLDVPAWSTCLTRSWMPSSESFRNVREVIQVFRDTLHGLFILSTFTHELMNEY